MRALLAAGANPRQEFRWQMRWTTAAFLACELDNREMLEVMLQFGIEVSDALFMRALGSSYGRELVGKVTTVHFTKMCENRKNGAAIGVF
jgi:hypothetical protein